MSAPSTSRLRRIVLTGSIAAITATGAWYGAGLKVQQERNEVGTTTFRVFEIILIRWQVKQATLEASDAEKMEQMQMLRGQLARQRDELQTKIDQLTNGTGLTTLPPRGR